jgi:5-methylcytosine-specific restriction endonuclease McrA
LEKAKNLASSKNKANMSMAETIVLALQEFVEKYDPVKKAERQKERQQKKESAAQPAENLPVTEVEKKTAPVTAVNPETETEKTGRDVRDGRETVPAAIVHEVNRRDGGQCAYVSPDGKRCGCSRFLHFHHVKPVAQGGKNTVENLITLCSAHHRLIHENEESKKYFPKRK